MAAINSAGEVSRPLPISDTLFFKIQGSADAISTTARAVRETTARHGSTRFEFAKTDEEAEAERKEARRRKEEDSFRDVSPPLFYDGDLVLMLKL